MRDRAPERRGRRRSRIDMDELMVARRIGEAVDHRLGDVIQSDSQMLPTFPAMSRAVIPSTPILSPLRRASSYPI